MFEDQNDSKLVEFKNLDEQLIISRIYLDFSWF